MSNKIVETILNRKIENFVSTFVEDSKSIFYQENNLIHPGEFGKYRENAFKELLSILINTNFKISDGFIITSNDKVSTQCDIVIYDNVDLPLLENSLTQFFTIESVIAIGEIKSTMSKSDFQKALRKLAKNKELSDHIMGIEKKKPLNAEEYKMPITFLICKNLNFSFENIDFDKIYEGIPRKYWHNLILSIENGIYAYEFDFNLLTGSSRSTFVNNGGIINAKVQIEHSLITVCENIFPSYSVFKNSDISNKYEHITYFLTLLIGAIDSKTTYHTELLRYVNLVKANVFNK